MFLKRRSFFEKYDKILYLPIEIHSREFHAKLYLSYQASQRGWIVIIGPEYDVNKLARYMPPGVYFGNGFHNKATNISRILKKSGHKIILQDEEGLVRWSPELYKEYRFNPEINNYVDYFLSWGEEDKEIIKSIIKDPKKSKPIGNLRLDLLNSNLQEVFSDEVNEIKNKNGDFVLINGNFGRTNHINGKDYYVKDIKLRGWLDTPYKKEYQFQGIAFQKKIFEKMIDLSIAIAKTGQKVVVRPHPSENLEVWKKKTKNFSKNIKIIRSGNVIPWLVASKFLIHNGCGTAIEGLLLDKTVISYRPLKDPKVETFLPNEVSICMETEQDILNFLKNFKNGNFNVDKKDTKNILDKYIKKNEFDKDASLRILDLIENFNLQKKTDKIKSFKNDIQIEMTLFKSMITRIIFKKNFSYLKKKCPKLNLEKVNKILDFFSSNKNNHSKLWTSNLTKDSIIILSKLD